MSTRALKRRFINCTLIALLCSCSRTGLEVPPFVDRRPEPPPYCFTTPPTIRIVPAVAIPAPASLPAGRQTMRFVDWRIRNTCAPRRPANPPNSNRRGERHVMNCTIVGGVDRLAVEQFSTGDCQGTSTGTPGNFFHDSSFPGQPGSRTRQIVAMRITGGNVCVTGTVTYGDGTTQELPMTAWRVTTTGSPDMGYSIVADPTRPGGTRIDPVGVVMRDCPDV